ncbi:MAG TPA: hypothetical protein VGM88_27810 [Kofleriaceae bacterium]|jgi:hypothetical protein
MRAAALAVLIGGAAYASPGRVVRVERPKHAGGASTVCGELRHDTGICLGPQPHPGDRIVLADVSGAYELEIRTVAPMTSLLNPGSTRPAPPGCEGLFWQISTDARSTLPHNHGSLFGVVGDYDVSRVRALGDADRLTSPTGEPSDRVFGGLDLDGDGTPDVIMGLTRCADASPSCMAIWDRQGAKFVATSMIPLETCAQ